MCMALVHLEFLVVWLSFRLLNHCCSYVSVYFSVKQNETKKKTCLTRLNFSPSYVMLFQPSFE